MKLQRAATVVLMPGWYWYRETEDRVYVVPSDGLILGKWAMIEVGQEGHELVARFKYFGGTRFCIKQRLVRCMPGEWVGPLPEPEF